MVTSPFKCQTTTLLVDGRLEADKVIKTTINKDTKTPGGTTGTIFCAT